MQLSGGLYSYNRFDAYEKALEEGKGASSPEKMKKKVDKAGKKSVKGGRYLVDYDEKEEEKEEGESAGGEGGAMGEGVVYGREAGAPRPEAGGMRRLDKIKKEQDKKVRVGKAQAEGEARQKVRDERIKQGLDPNTGKPKVKKEEVEVMDEAVYGGTPAEPKKEKKMLVTNVDKRGGTPAYANMKAGDKRYKAADHMKEGSDLNNEETTENVMENRMAMYSRALGVMGAHYSGPGFGVSALEEKKEEEKDEKKKSEDKKADKDYDGDGEVESSKEEYFGSKDKAIKKAMAKEEVGITKEAVVEYLVSEGYANNEVSAEILHQHISDEFLAKIEEQMGG